MSIIKLILFKTINKRGVYKPNAVENIRDLINEVSKNKGAISIILKSELEKIPAKIRVLYEF